MSKTGDGGAGVEREEQRDWVCRRADRYRKKARRDSGRLFLELRASRGELEAAEILEKRSEAARKAAATRRRKAKERGRADLPPWAKLIDEE